MLRSDGATVAIRLRVIGRDPIASGFGVHAKIGVKRTIFLTGDEDVLDGGGISRAGGSWANGRGRGGSGPRTGCHRPVENVGGPPDHEARPADDAQAFESPPPPARLSPPPVPNQHNPFLCY